MTSCCTVTAFDQVRHAPDHFMLQIQNTVILLWMEEDSAIEEKRLTQWKDHVEWNLVPVIAVLPKGSSVTEEDCFEWGMAECLKEPLSTLAVCRRLEYVITLFQSLFFYRRIFFHP